MAKLQFRIAPTFDADDAFSRGNDEAVFSRLSCTSAACFRHGLAT
jgi:hypothetical protein